MFILVGHELNIIFASQHISFRPRNGLFNCTLQVNFMCLLFVTGFILNFTAGLQVIFCSFERLRPSHCVHDYSIMFMVLV